MKQIIINKKMIGVLFFILIIFSLAFSIETPDSVALGDIILTNIGLKAWSNEAHGFHYTIIYSFVMFIIGYKGATHFINDYYPRFFKRLPLILIVLVISYPLIYSTINKIVKTFSKGINAIDYNRKNSNCDFKTDSYGNIVLNANLQFKNFSSKDVKFYIKLVPDNFVLDNFIDKEPITALNFDSNSPEEFTLQSKSVETFQVKFETHSKNGSAYQGNMKNLSIIIFTGDKEKQFIKN